MRERSQTGPRRRSGPKQPLPPRDVAYDPYNYDAAASESPYYTIDNTEDIYGTTLLPSQRCYVDPWDLENYDYVRKKLDTAAPPSPSDDYYDTSLTPSPAGEPVATRYYYAPQTPPPSPPHMTSTLASTLPRNRRKSSSHLKCELDCCAAVPVPPLQQQQQQRRRTHYEEQLRGGGGGGGSGLYGIGGAGRSRKYEDYMMNMAAHMQDDEDMEQNVYTGYGGFSSASSNEPHSSIGDESVSTLLLHTPGFGAITRKRGVVLPKPAPKLEFPAPPSLPPAYDYCNPYATLPYCSVSDCYECLSSPSQQNGGASLIYAAPSSATIYGFGGEYGSSSIYGDGGMQSSSTLGRRPSSRRPSTSLYGGIYAHKFGMSKKGLLQIDYSCSWNDLDRVIGRNY